MNSNEQLLLSVVVVNYRSWGMLDQLLRGLQGAGPSQDEPTRIEIIVVDNDSGDGQIDAFRAEWPQVHWVDSGWNGGFAFGCNRGAEHACGTHLLFLNPDVEAKPEALLELRRIAIQQQADLLSCRQQDHRGRLRKVTGRFPNLLRLSRLGAALDRALDGLRPTRQARQDRHVSFSGTQECDWITGAVVLIARSTFDRLQGWSEAYWMYSEDLDLCRRARNLSLRVAVTGEVSLTHHHGGASRANPEVEAITRSEVVISKHVYVEQHFPFLSRALAHGLLVLSRFMPLLIISVFDLITLSRITKLKARRRVAGTLWRYYCSQPWRRGWRSARLEGRPGPAREPV